MRASLCLLLLSASANAQLANLFTIGIDDGSTNEFSQEINDTNPPSATALDDHYFLAGTDPADPPRPDDEEVANFEWALTTWDPSNHIHFPLTALQAGNDGIITVNLDFIWSGMSGGGTPASEVSISFNGGPAIYTTPSFESYRTFSFSVPTSTITLNTGANYLTMTRTGGTANTWIAIDTFSVDLDPTALQDADSDGIPLHWETLYQLSDNNAADASADLDGDTLTALQEFTAGTNPRLADTDEDNLTDQLETTTDPLNPDSDDDGILDGNETSSNPALADSDSDGASDGWEIATGFDPQSNTSTPPAWSGSIGINFRSGQEDTRGTWPTISPNGIVPQTNWNHTNTLRWWGVSSGTPLLTGDQNDIVSPTAGTIVDSSGSSTALTLTFSYDGVRTSSNYGSPAANLLHGFLANDSTFPATLNLGNIPFSSYDLYLYLSADYIGTTSTLRLNADPNTDQTFRSRAVSPISTFIEPMTSPGPGATFANVVRLPGLSGSTQALELFQAANNTSGIAAIQIVDTSIDTDSDGLPDYWELRHKSNPAVSNATADSDSDGLDHLAEFNAGSNPNLADSDGDGLNDLAEVNAGTQVNYADSDGDGLSDFAELNAPLPSNPLLADSDSDGTNDAAEAASFSDPQSASHALPPVPAYQSSPTGLLWEATDLQFVFDRNVPIELSGGHARTAIEWHVLNRVQSNNWRTFRFRLREVNGGLGYSFNSWANGGFSNSGGWDNNITNNADITASLGLSGFGPCDTTDPLTFRMQATENAGTWTLVFSIINQTTATTVASHTFPDVIPSSTILDQSALWSSDGINDQSDFNLDYGISLFRTATPVHQLPGMAHCADADNDGMSDAWEIAHSLNPNDPADAALDPDSDNLTNLRESLLGTLPNNQDSDNDGVNDDVEADQFTDPLLATSKPHFFTSPPAATTDLNGNGFSDVWESHFQTGSLNPALDSDGDGQSNLREAIAGTDPLDATSNFRLSSAPSSTSGFLDLQWPNMAHKTQALESATGLTSFTTHPEAPGLIGDTYSLTTEATGDSQFFRASITDRDTDLDGLSDWDESILGSSATSASSLARAVPIDTNNDGAPDTTVSGDLAAFHSLYQNQTNFSAGTPPPSTTPHDASRLLLQATFGPTIADIEKVRSMGINAWITDQIENQPATHHRDYIEEIMADFDGPRTKLEHYSYNELSDFVNGHNVQSSFARAAISGPDQLRQRVAFALSQILVISRRDAGLNNRPLAVSKYYDRLIDQAFGNYYDLLLAVSLDPCMGLYLSHVGNQPPDLALNRFPDENYAREVMQLFSIGLWELNNDGTQKLDGQGQPIPTYTNTQITEMARVFTGLWYGKNPWGSGGWQDADFLVPMEMFTDQHDFNEKTLLNGFVIPARAPSQANGLQDIRDTIRHLVEHPTCAPFISKSLIQFLITSNPSPQFIERISNVFIDNGSGVRGDLKAVVTAILTDPEARDPGIAAGANFGILREPVIRTMHLARLGKFNRSGNALWWDYDTFLEETFQAPYSAPTVFNFYRPDYTPPGALDDANLDGPVFEITNSYTAVSVPNTLWDIVVDGFEMGGRYHFTPDYSDLLPYAQDHEALIDKLNLLICGGSMSATTRSQIKTSLDTIDPDDHSGRVRLAIYLAIMSPEGAIQR
ncbi:MAG: DUF1800 family protein [Verrucomicrobiaceae bacterium]